jgi:putative transposase
MVSFTDDLRGTYGVEPISAVLPIAPSTYDEYKPREVEPKRLPARLQRDQNLCGEIRRVWEKNFRVYGVRKVWRQLNRKGISVARCTVARLIGDMRLQGAVRGRKFKTTILDTSAARPWIWSSATSRRVVRTSCGSRM